jgi:hypothetical protein
MRSANKVHVVLKQKLLHNLGPNRKGNAPVVLVPELHILLWVAPEEIA